MLIAALLLFNHLAPKDYEIVNNPPRGNHIIAFGDSLTYGTGAAPGEDYPSQLGHMLGLQVINAGIPGDTTASALSRIDQIIDQHPDI
ncbi:MAG: arylesterase, partial [Gammaproteobacteria bacterium]